MTTLAIDLDELDQLCENQKKLDDIFDSLWDDDPLMSSSMPVIEHTQINADAQALAQKDQALRNLLLPVLLEIAAIYYGIVHFT